MHERCCESGGSVKFTIKKKKKKGLLYCYFYHDLFGQLNFLKMAVTSAEHYISFEEYVNKYEDNK